MYAQIGIIVGRDLPQNQQEWLEDCDSDFYASFVEITVGDTSKPEGIDITTVLSPERMIDLIQAEEIDGYLVVDKIAYPEVAESLRALDLEESKGFWDNEIMFFVGY